MAGSMTGRATWHPAEGQWGEWRCYACGEVLAIGAGYAQAALNARGRPRDRANILADLVPLPGTRSDGLTAFGLPKRRLTSSKDPRGRLARPGTFTGPRDLPIFAYCPRRGICGRGQTIDKGPATVKARTNRTA
jgi:hypothetical protein